MKIIVAVLILWSVFGFCFSLLSSTNIKDRVLQQAIYTLLCGPVIWVICLIGFVVGFVDTIIDKFWKWMIK